jgi:hypothetical protein
MDETVRESLHRLDVSGKEMPMSICTALTR